MTSGSDRKGSDGGPNEWVNAPKVLVAVASSTVTVAVLYYFGWVYTDRLYEQIGIDAYTLELGTHEYVIRSLNTVAPAIPWVVVALATLILVAWSLPWRPDQNPKTSKNEALEGELNGDRNTLDANVPATASTRWRKHAIRAVAGLGGVLIVLRLRVWTGERGAYLWLVAVTLLGSVAWAYLANLKDSDDQAVRAVRFATVSLIVLAFVYGVFEVVRYRAEAVAQEVMVENEEKCFMFPLVTIYSAVDLHLEESGAQLRTLGPSGDAMMYRYDNLRRFLHDNGRLIVWPADRPLREGAILLLETDAMRLDTHPQNDENKPCPRLSES